MIGMWRFNDADRFNLVCANVRRAYDNGSILLWEFGADALGLYVRAPIAFAPYIRNLGGVPAEGE